MNLRFPFLRRPDRTEKLQRELEAVRAELRGHLSVAERLVAEERRRVLEELAMLDGSLAASARTATPVESSAWSDTRWTSWMPSPAGHESLLRIGETSSTEHDVSAPVNGLPIGVPVGAPVVVVNRSSATLETADALLRSLVLRAAAASSGQSRFVLLDAARDGEVFQATRRLDRVVTGFGDARRAIEQLAGDIARIESTYLDRRVTRLTDVPLARRLGEVSHVVAVSSFPHRFDEYSVRTMVELSRRAAACDVQLLLHLDLASVPAAGDLVALLADAGATVLELDHEPVHPALVGVVLDDAPAGHVVQLVLQRLASVRPLDELVRWDELQGLSDAAWGSETGADQVVAPIASDGTDVPVEIRFGTDPLTGAHVGHGLLVGRSDRGRQHFFDALLAGLVTRHSPDQLRLSLIESRHHATFAPWRELPHADLVGLTPSPRQAKEAVAGLRAEVDRRLGSAARRSVRTVMILDGCEQLFDDADDSVTDDLRLVLERGHEVGVHLLLGASQFRGLGALHRTGLFERFDLRIALELAPDDALGREEFGPRGGRLVERVCDRPFRAVINQIGGIDDGTIGVQTLVLDSNRRDEIVQRVRMLSSSVERAVVVDGSRRPTLSDSAWLASLADADPVKRADVARELALRGTQSGGLGLDDWDPTDGPRLVVVGRAEALSGEATLVLRRRPTENIAVVSPHADVLTAAALATVTGAFLSNAVGNCAVTLVDPSPGTGPVPEALSRGLAVLAAEGTPVSVVSTETQIAGAIVAAAHTIEARRGRDEDQLATEPTLLFVVRHPDRVRGLGRVPAEGGRTDSELGRQLRFVTTNGPSVGVHVVVLATSLTALRVVFSDEVIQQDFRHRIVTKVPSDDSFVLLRTSAAAALDEHDGVPIPAMLFDGHLHSTARFTPFDADLSAGSLADQIERLLGTSERALTT